MMVHSKKRQFSRNVIGLAVIFAFLFIGKTSAKPGFLEGEKQTLDSRELEIAYRQTTKAIQANPRDYRSYALRGKILFAREEFSAAIKDLDQALRLNPNSKDNAIYEVRAQCFVQESRLDRAEIDLLKALKLSPTVTSYKMLGEIYNQENKLKEAEATFSKGILMGPSEFWLFEERGKTYMKQGKYAKALSDFNTLVKLRSKEPRGYALRAQIYRKLNKFNLAAKDEESVKELSLPAMF